MKLISSDTYNISLNSQLLLEIYNILINMAKDLFILIGTYVKFAIYYDHAFGD